MAKTWRGPLAPLDRPDAVGRRVPIRNVDSDVRKPPMWLRAQLQDWGGHNGVVRVGSIDQVWIQGSPRYLWGSGRWLANATASETFASIKDGFPAGVSVDLEPKTGKMMAATLVDCPAFEDAKITEIADTDTDDAPTDRLTPVQFAVATAEDEHVEWGVDEFAAFDGPEDDEYDITTFAVEAEYAYQQYLAGAFADDLRDEAQFANWITRIGGHLPPYVKRIAKHLRRKGFSESHSIATALNATDKMCATGDVSFPGLQHINPGSRAEACAAVAQWEQLKARARAS